MQLLTNDNTALSFRRKGKPPVESTAAIFGPFKKPVNVRVVLAAVYIVAALVVALDLFVWRA